MIRPTTYSELPSFKELQKRISLNGGRVIAFVGAGLSQSAQLPSWPALKEKILADYRKEAETFDEGTKRIILKQCDSAQHIDDLWVSFTLIKRIRPPAVFEASIRRHLSCSSKTPPTNYLSLWKLGISGIVTLNLDDFAQRAYSKVYPGSPLEMFTGSRIRGYVDVLTRSEPFLCHLHGTLGESSSWVFTDEDRTKLRSSDGLKEFFNSCFLSTSVIFIGITADDIGAGGLLSSLLQDTRTSRVGNHYWISDRLDPKATSFADTNGLGRITYSADHNHQELSSLLLELKYDKIEPPLAEVITPSVDIQSGLDSIWPTPTELLNIHDTNQLREKLNQIASFILNKQAGDRKQDYQDFLEEYELPISRAWFIPRNAKAQYFSYSLKRLIAGEGAFGRVYEAIGEDGRNYAVKVIHNDVHEDPEMLEAFRRGVASMRIIASRNIDGVVAIRDAWELPASIVMDFIGGLNLDQAVIDKAIIDWGSKLEIFEQLAAVLLKAHRLPEVVVHRDVRPPNVILEDFYQSGEEIKVALVDFDLSWHRDAFGKSIQQTSGIHGYFAPEQYSKISGVSSRNTLVDSFGLGMTMSYVITGRHPQFGDIERNDRDADVKRNFRVVRCDRWKSIPTRLARLVLRATRKIQQERIDMTAIHREISSLRRLYEKDQFTDIRLIIDELAHRSSRLQGDYDWDEGSGTMRYESPTGLSITIKPRGQEIITAVIEWRNLGNAQYHTVKKYFGNVAPKVESRLKASGWICEADAKYDGTKVAFERKIDVKSTGRSELDNFSQDLDYAIINLSYSGQ